MKRLIALLVLLFSGCFCLPPSLSASAEEERQEERYAVAAREDVWLYSAENEESGLFLLPYTYYVRVLREGALFTAVRYLDDVSPYKSVTGYCKTELLTFVDFIPERPFLRREISVVYTIPAETTMGRGSFDKIEKKFVYYGASYAGTARFYYVYADGIFDYVPAMQEVLFELNTDYLKPSSGEAPPPEETGSSPSALQIVVICAAGLAVAAIAAIVLRGKRPAPAPAEDF